MKHLKILVAIVILTTLLSCMEFTTDDPNKAFRSWTGINEENTEVKVLYGRYWRSAHFTLEYEAVFKMTASKEWVNQLIEFNSLKASEGPNTPTPINDVALDWFHPTSDYKMYTDSDRFKHLYLWIHPSSDTIYIFDRVL